MSQIDIAPTMLGLLDFRYYTKFFGRDVLRAPPESDRAFVANYQTLGYLKGDRMVLLHPKRKTEVFRVDGEGPGTIYRVSDDDHCLEVRTVGRVEPGREGERSGEVCASLDATDTHLHQEMAAETP